MAAGERAQRLRRSGVTVFDLGPGQPDFDTPEHIREAAIAAIRDGHTRYTAAAGMPELREAVATMYSAREDVDYSADETLITNGGKHGLHAAIFGLIEEGDEVILPTPYWVSFPEQIRIAGGTPVFVDTAEEDGFALRAETVAAACTDRTRMIILNTPSNPSGAIIDRAQMEAITKFAIERGIYLMLDECYGSLLYDGAEHLTPLIVGPEAKPWTILCGSCSKAYAMTGWRIGYLAGPRAVIGGLARLQGHTTSNPCSISQYAALAALTGDQSPVQEMLATFAERRAKVLPRVRALPGVTCVEPRGAFYVFPNVSALLSDRHPSSADLATHFIDAAHVVTVAGAAFGREGYLRLSYATSMEVLDEALDRLASACAELID
jgi:aspartate aminotransferase